MLPLTHAKGDDRAFVFVVGLGLIAMAAAVLIKHLFYIRRTPLVRIDDTTLTWFGNGRRQRRSFLRNTISEISLSTRPLFWRSSFRLSIVADGEISHLWIPYSAGGSVPALSRALREEFPSAFKAVLA
jgi:hypothetical protein